MKKDISKFSHILPPLLVFLFAFCLYLLTLAPTVTGEDSGELITAAYCWGIPHPPGYPLWTLLAGITIRLLPFIDSVAMRVNLLSAFLASSAATVFFMTLKRFFRVSTIIAIIGSLCFAAGRHLWSQAIITEVYTLHILLTCLLVYFILAWVTQSHPKYLYIISFLVGLALTNHHLTVLMGPFLLLLVLLLKPRTFLSIKTVIICLFLLIIGLLPYFYLPLAATRHPYMNWGNPSNTENFYRHVTRQQYGDDSMHAARTPQRILGHLKVLAQWNRQQYTLWAVPIIITGIIYLGFVNRRYLYITLSLFILHSIILAEILNFSFQRQELFCNQVFQLPAYIFTALWLVLGLHAVSVLIAKKITVSPWRQCTTSLLPLLIASIIIGTNYKHNNMRHYYYAYDHGTNILNSLADQAIIIPSGDHNTFPLIYLHYVEKQRPDITIADKYGYIDYELYRDMPNAPKRIRTRQEREAIENFLITQSHRPVYYTIQPSLSRLPDYKIRPQGMLFRIYRKDEPSNIDSSIDYQYRNFNGQTSILDHAACAILSDYHFYLAAKYLHAQQRDLAMEHIEQVAQLSDGLKEVMNNIGTLFAEFGIFDQSVRFYEISARLDPDYLTPRWNLALFFKANRQIVPAIQVFNDLAQKDPEDFRIFGELGFLLQTHGDMTLAIKNWAKSLALQPDQPQILRAFAEYYVTSQSPSQKNSTE